MSECRFSVSILISDAIKCAIANELYCPIKYGVGGAVLDYNAIWTILDNTSLQEIGPDLATMSRI